MPTLDTPAWARLWQPGRAALGEALRAGAPLGLAPPERQALQRLWLLEAERLPHEAERLGRSAPLADAALQHLVEARCAQMYDVPADALRHAQQAFDTLQARDPQHPLCLHARFALGFAWLESGHPARALPLVQQLLRETDRDHLPLLQLDALHLLARCADELGQPEPRAAALAHAQALVAQCPEATGLPAWDSLQRLAWRLALSQGPQPAPPGQGFASQALAALRTLVDGPREGLSTQLLALRQTALLRYLPRKWRLELAWLESSQGRGLPPWEPADDLYGLQAQVLAAGHRLRQGQALPELQALRSTLAARQLQRLEQRLALVQALATADADSLQAWLQHPAAEVLDLFWLAGPALPLLRSLQRLPATPPALLAGLQPLIERLLGPQAPPARRPPPADLTAREWQVLQLIGQQLSNEQIAHQLHLSLATVKTHINRLYAKLALGSRAQAVLRARQLQSS
ncbi:MAG: LuxR C-terminal-related transcriptional regulator [Inhella sp.]